MVSFEITEMTDNISVISVKKTVKIQYKNIRIYENALI